MIFSLILFAHWIGDFVFQSSDMALKKNSSRKWLFYHVGVYTFILLLFSFTVFNLEEALVYGIVNGFLHLLTDFFTSKIVFRYRDQPRVFFPLLGLDQFIHVFTLYWMYELGLELIMNFLDL